MKGGGYPVADVLLPETLPAKAIQTRFPGSLFRHRGRTHFDSIFYFN